MDLLVLCATPSLLLERWGLPWCVDKESEAWGRGGGLGHASLRSYVDREDEGPVAALPGAAYAFGMDVPDAGVGVSCQLPPGREPCLLTAQVLCVLGGEGRRAGVWEHSQQPMAAEQERKGGRGTRGDCKAFPGGDSGMLAVLGPVQNEDGGLVVRDSSRAQHQGGTRKLGELTVPDVCSPARP